MPDSPRLDGKSRVRVFICSTFRDMQAERDALATRAFPALRRMAERRGAGVQEIDLRWGITAEAAEQGRVLDICLAEIDACRPFFIAILGERYGWIDPEARARLAVNYPHLVRYADRSVTELEIRHALHDPPADTAAGTPIVFIRTPTAGPESAERAALDRLISEMRTRSLPLRHYSTPEELAVAVVDELGQRLDAYLQPASTPEARVEQTAFQAMHAATGFQRPALLARLRRRLWFTRRLVVEGPEGAGKSALLIEHAAQRAAPEHDDHFVALAAAGGRFSRAFQDMGEAASPMIGAGPRGIFEALDARVARSAGTLFIDGPEMAQDDVFGSALDWIPVRRPKGRLIVATGDPDLAAALAGRGFGRLAVEPLSATEKRAVLRGTLAAYGKVLAKSQEQRIVANPKTGSAGFLRVIAEELRQFGVFERLDAEIDRLLGRRDTADLFVAVLERLEHVAVLPDGIVRRALRLISAARSGLAEHEILELLGGAHNRHRCYGGRRSDLRCARSCSIGPACSRLRHRRWPKPSARDTGAMVSPRRSPGWPSISFASPHRDVRSTS